MHKNNVGKIARTHMFALGISWAVKDGRTILAPKIGYSQRLSNQIAPDRAQS
jgi:hypothetical protein